MPSLWTRIGSAVAGWFRREPREGRWDEGHAFSLHGWTGFRPWVLPRRAYRLYQPRGHSRLAPSPLVTLIHGCKQTADELARGTRIAGLADRLGAMVLMPEQKDSANPYRCWNWFDQRTASGLGEAAIVAAMIRKIGRRHRVDRKRSIVAGMSAGAALAAIIGVRHPSLVRGVVSHSGIACGAAASAFTVLTVMRRGPETDVAAIGASGRALPGAEAGVALLAIQGRADDVVAARHAAALVRQYLALNGVAVPPGADSTLPDADSETRDTSAPPLTFRVREWRREGRPIARLVEIDGLGHAWSGGDASLPFNAAGPDATAMLGEWIEAIAR